VGGGSFLSAFQVLGHEVVAGVRGWHASPEDTPTARGIAYRIEKRLENGTPATLYRGSISSARRPGEGRLPKTGHLMVSRPVP